MRNRTGFACLLIIALGFAGCGSSGKTTSTGPTGSSAGHGATTKPVFQPVKSVTYTVKLGPDGSGAAAAKASGLAVVSIKGGTDEICWSFSDIKNVIDPVEATIQGDLHVGIISSPLGPRKVIPSGCRLRSALLLRLLEDNVGRLYVNVRSLHHTEGGLRGRL